MSVLAESLGIEVYFYDLEDKLALGNARRCNSLDELLHKVDIVSVHVDGRKENKNLFDESKFKIMKPGSYFLNLSCGKVVVPSALAEAISSRKILGAAIDEYPMESKSNNERFESVLRILPNVILTPHIDGSKQEAQENIGHFVPGKIIEYINTGRTTGNVNFPNLRLPVLENAHRLLHIHHNKPGILAEINKILAQHNTNIEGQNLKTNESIGYVITDIDKTYNNDVIKDLKGIEGTIRFKVLY